LLGRGARPLANLDAPVSMAERLEFSIVERKDVGDDLLLRLRPRS
jgi:riboflavin biosynthesis pyrimidine reductase